MCGMLDRGQSRWLTCLGDGIKENGPHVGSEVAGGHRLREVYGEGEGVHRLAAGAHSTEGVSTGRLHVVALTVVVVVVRRLLLLLLRERSPLRRGDHDAHPTFPVLERDLRLHCHWDSLQTLHSDRKAHATQPQHVPLSYSARGLQCSEHIPLALQNRPSPEDQLLSIMTPGSTDAKAQETTAEDEETTGAHAVPSPRRRLEPTQGPTLLSVRQSTECAPVY